MAGDSKVWSEIRTTVLLEQSGVGINLNAKKKKQSLGQVVKNKSPRLDREVARDKAGTFLVI